MSTRPFAVITGGGTGGHVSPALAIAQALVDRGHLPEEIEFVGGRRGIEGRLVPEAGFVLHALPGRGVKRSASLENLVAVGGLAGAVAIASAMALRNRPRVVICVGGYAGFAYGAVAIALRIPLLVVTVDAVPGAVQRLLGRFADRNAVSFPTTTLPRAVVTGPPVRNRVLEVTRSEAGRLDGADRLKVAPGRRLIVVTSGSLGAASVNRATVELAQLWRDRSDLAIYHVGGHRNGGEAMIAAKHAGLMDPGHLDGSAGLQYRYVEFDPDLPSALGACDIAVSRAGAVTVAELTAIGVPSVLVPLPGAPSDHQAKNAAALASAGASLTVADAQCSGASLAEAIDSCLSTRGRLDEMATAARSLGRRDAAQRIAELASALADASR
jgi:UDP-N-acetylglucosamine--N-acetylmuramyl-(pentapeptide) pyrophosphoryl-undecaprenol N-acetylglucosamine transferase